MVENEEKLINRVSMEAVRTEFIFLRASVEMASGDDIKKAILSHIDKRISELEKTLGINQPEAVGFKPETEL